MSRDPVRASTQFFGGRVCLDFANTLDWRTSGNPVELIPDYAALLSWSSGRGTLPPSAVDRLRAQIGGSAARDAIARAHRLRAHLWDASEALMGGGIPDLEPFNALLRTMPPQPVLSLRGGSYVHDLEGESVDEPLWPVLWSLTAVLASEDARRLGCCQAQGCGWFFVDESPNRTRLWCSSELCGNRERARRAYAKRRTRSVR